jgi:hypothetical protein
MQDYVKPIVPINYFIDAIKLLKLYKVEFITFDDLIWEGDFDYKNSYPVEFKNWKNAINNGEFDKNKIYVLIQHDVDSGPRSTINICKIEKEMGVRSNIMTFNRWVVGSEPSNVEKYPIDRLALKNFENEGFLINYHANALDIAKLDSSKIYEEFDKDVDELSKDFNIKYFSPHGGKKTINGETNNSFNYYDNVKNKIRWVDNRYSVKFDAKYSDGGLKSRIINNDPKCDILTFIKKMLPGKRYKMLIHPQYYGYKNIVKLNSKLDWYNNLF